VGARMSDCEQQLQALRQEEERLNAT
jgi:hypothetical protein